LWQFYEMSTSFRLLLPLSIACLGLLLGGAGAPAGAAEPARATPDFALKALDGRNYRLSEYRGEVTAILFWASWCGGCTRELKRMQRLSDVYRSAGLQVLGVVLDPQGERARSVAEAAGAGFPQLLDSSGAVGRAYRLETLPTVMLIGRDGTLRATHAEMNAQDEHALLARLRMLLDE
jgi:peroxiredoxin